MVKVPVGNGYRMKARSLRSCWVEHWQLRYRDNNLDDPVQLGTVAPTNYCSIEQE